MNTTSICCNSDPIQDFIIQLIATLIGAGLGFAFALWHDRKKQKHEKQDKINHIIESIKQELKEIQVITTDEPVKFSELMDWNTTKHLFEGKRFNITTPAYDTTVNSGDFVLLPTTLQTRISGIYNRIHDCRKDMENIANFYSTPAFMSNNAESVAKNLRQNLHTRLDELKEEYSKFSWD